MGSKSAMSPAELAAIEARDAFDAVAAILETSDHTPPGLPAAWLRLQAALHAEQEARARVEALAAMLDDELRRVEAGYSTPESLTRARETYARALAPDASEGEPT